MDMDLRPLPTVQPENTPFFDALSEGRFVVPRCTQCRDYNWSPYPACRSCLSTALEWTAVSGRGHVYTYTIIHTAPRPFAHLAPYVWGFVELEERPRTMLVQTNIFDVELDEIHVGMPVEVAFRRADDSGLTMYHFVPSQGESR
jgi:uncharacterized OB-fold protein